MAIQLLVVGETSTGKSASIRDLRNQDTWYYANFENGRPLPFKNTLKKADLIDPHQLHSMLEVVKGDPKAGGIVIDSLTYMMNAFETLHVLTSEDTRSAWGGYQQFFKALMTKDIPAVKVPVIFLAQTTESKDQFGNPARIVPIKGALRDVGIESFFSIIIAAKKLSINDLSKYSSDLLIITDDEKELGYKHVFQTRPTKETLADRIRAPMGMWEKKETFIDNNLQFVLDRITQYTGS